MEFYTQNKLQRPVRLCESTRQFAFDSLNQVYGKDTLKVMDIPLDDIENLGSLSPLEKYDTAISEIARIALGISSLLGVEFIPYHAYAGSKAVFIGKEDNGNPDWIPTEAQLTEAGLILQAHGISVL